MTKVRIKVIRKTKGGPGSGNWGHAGIPGHRGGSAPSKGSMHNLHGGTDIGNIAYIDHGKSGRSYFKVVGKLKKSGWMDVMHYRDDTGDFTSAGAVRIKSVSELGVPTDSDIKSLLSTKKPTSTTKPSAKVSIGGSGDAKLPTKKEVNELGAKLNSIKRDRVVGNQIDRDPDVARITSSGKNFDSKSTKFVGMEDGSCHWNVAELYRRGDIDSIVIGYTNNGDAWYQHTWGLKNGKVIETTASNNGNPYYYGLLLSKTEADAFTDWTAANPPGGGVVRRVA